MNPLDDIAKSGSNILDRWLSLVAALIVVAIIIVAAY